MLLRIWLVLVVVLLVAAPADQMASEIVDAQTIGASFVDDEVDARPDEPLAILPIRIAPTLHECPAVRPPPAPSSVFRPPRLAVG